MTHLSLGDFDGAQSRAASGSAKTAAVNEMLTGTYRTAIPLGRASAGEAHVCTPVNSASIQSQYLIMSESRKTGLQAVCALATFRQAHFKNYMDV